MLVLDNSGSVGSQRPYVISFAREVVNQFQMGTTKAQIALVEFHTTVTTHSALTPSLTTIVAALDNAPPVGSATFLSGGIDGGQAAATGAGARAGVEKVMILLSDGVQTVGGDDNTAIAAAATAKAAGTKLISVGFGDVSLVTLGDIASQPCCQFTLYRPTAAELVESMIDGLFDICEIGRAHV